MKLLFDENLSHWLAPNLADLYPDSIHVRDIGLKSEPDRDIWQYAIKNGFAIVTKDSDFNERSIGAVNSPKVIWIRAGNCSAREIENLLRDKHESVRNYLSNKQASCLVIGQH